MSQKETNFFNIDNLSKGLERKLSNGINAHIFPGDQAMVSIVKIEPKAVGTVHEHPQEQWSMMVSGSALRIQDNEKIPVSKGDFWCTPGGVRHGILGGPDGALIFDFFAPARDEYRKKGFGFAAN